MAWLPGYAYRKPLVLTGGASGALTNFQLDIDIAYVAAKMQSDFDDIRFTQNNGTTLIDAWLESKVDSTSAETWVEFPITPANTVTQDYYMYYGNAIAAGDWNISTTFIHGDDFEDGTVGSAPAGWTVSAGSPRVQSDQAKTGTKSLKFGASSTDSIYKIFGKIISEEVSIDFDFRANATNDTKHWCAYEEGNAAYPYGPVSFARNTGYFANYSGGAYHNKQTYNAGQWYAHQMRYDPSDNTFDWIIDSNTYSGLSFRNAKTNLDKIEFSNNFSSVFWIDNFRVRKYASGPPTYAFGGEESVPVGVRPPRVLCGPFGGPLGGPIQ